MNLLSGHLQAMVSQPSIRIFPVSHLVRILGAFDNEKADNLIRSPAGYRGEIGCCIHRHEKGAGL